MANCRKCAIELIDENWSKSDQKHGTEICSRCRYLQKKTRLSQRPNLSDHPEQLNDCECNGYQVPLTVDNIDKGGYNQGELICKACERTRTNAQNLQLKLETFQEYGDECVCCGEFSPIFLTIDHIDENGAIHRKNIGRMSGARMTGINFYRWLRKQGYPKDNYQVLCFNCNFAKHVLGTCPHQIK